MESRAGVRPTPPDGCPRTEVDLWSDDVLADPYPTYRVLRDLGPVVWLDRYGVAVVSRFAEVKAVLTDWETFSSGSGVAVADSSNRLMGPTVLTTDPPRHEKFRRPLASQLSPAALADAVELVAHEADEVVERVVARGRFDGVVDVARPYSATVVASLLGLPLDGREQELPELSGSAFNVFGPENPRQAAGLGALQRLGEYAATLIAEGSLRPGSRGEQLVKSGHGEQITTYTWPGVDTTVNALGSALLLFAQNPDQWDLVRADPSLIPSAWNEVLRLQSPSQAFARLTTRDAEIAGVTLPAGTRVLVINGSANRDERRYPDPDRFDVTRNPLDQLAFGRGIHLCVGIHLARMEGHALLAAFARRVARFLLVGRHRWEINNSIRGLATLPLEVRTS
jgi:cytochrome P450